MSENTQDLMEKHFDLSDDLSVAIDDDDIDEAKSLLDKIEANLRELRTDLAEVPVVTDVDAGEEV